jgi:rod shape-determining protein MreB
LLSKKIAIDFGTSTVRIYVKGEGVVITELSPLRDGVMADPATTKGMLNQLIDKVQGRPRIFRPEVMICVPSGVSSAERRDLTQAAISAGARQVWLIDGPLAAALGAGLPIAEARACAICDVGRGATEVAVIAGSGTVAVRSIRVGGKRMDAAIAAYLRRKHRLLIDERVAEEVKIAVGSAVPINPPLVRSVRGRDLTLGAEEALDVSSGDIVEAIAEPLRLITAALREVIDETPRRLVADIRERGIVLTGGGARLRGLDRYITIQNGIPARVADQPETSIVRGTGLALENFEVLKRNHSYVR